MTDREPRQPPQDLENEAALIASVLSSDDYLADVMAMVPDESYFFRADHAAIWRVILDFYAQGLATDHVTVGAEFKRRGLTYTADDPGTLLGGIVRDNPLTWYAPSYAANVVRASRLRAVIETGEAMIRDAYAHRDDADAVLARALATLQGEGAKAEADVVTAGSLVPAVVAAMDERAAGRLTGVGTPFSQLNALTGGLQPQDLVVVAARTSTGKTSFALNLAAAVAVDAGLPTLVVSLEMGNPLLIERTLAFRSDTHAMDVRSGRLTEAQSVRFEHAKRELGSAPFYLSHKPGRTLNKILSNARRAHARHGLKLIVVDYIQQISTGRNASLYETTTQVAKELKDLANDLSVPVVALSQLSRAAPNREEKRPRMTDLRDSGAIEEAADLILLLHRPDYYDPTDRPGLAELIVAKNRNGPPGECRLRFVKETMKFEDDAPATDADDSGVDWTKN